MRRIPFAPLLLAAAGLVPPAFLTWVAWTDAGAFGPVAVGFLFVYAALIFSFLGGTWWAFALQEERPAFVLLLLAVIPSLAGWALMAARQQTLAGYTLSALILLSPLVDAWLHRRGLTPSWWMSLRVPLSVGLALMVAVTTWTNAV
jgi:hypothetical protein